LIVSFFSQRLISGKGKIKKVKPIGYDDDNITMFKEIKASEFLVSDDHIQLLAKTSRIILDEERLINSPYTTDAFKECIGDIRVCGGGELRKILTWRKKILEDARKEKQEEA
jgi:AdoMet-dependent rRNA methyltransferase SPB1